MTCLTFHAWRAASSLKTDWVRVWTSIDTLSPEGGHARGNGCRIAPASRIARSLHFGQIEIERLRDIAQRVVVFVGDRIEARHRAHLAEGEILHAVERLADLLLHVLRQCLAIEHRIIPDRRRFPHDLELAAIGETFGAAALVDAIGDRTGFDLALADRDDRR